MKNIAVIGCGKFVEGKEGWAIGHEHAKGYLASGEAIALHGVDISPENLEGFGRAFAVPKERLFSSTEALYAALTPDCVSICTWPTLHFPLAVEALDRGVRGIACEKPLALDGGEIRELARRVREKGATCVVAHQRRLEAPFRALKEAVRSGKLGSQLTARGHVGDGWDVLSWTTHWFDMANFIFDRSPEWLMAGMDLGTSRRYGQAVEDGSIIFAHYGPAQSAMFLTGPGEGSSFWMEGERGTARICGTEIEVAVSGGVERISIPPEARGGFSELVGQMMRALDGGPEPLCSLAHSAAATEMAYAAQESARLGRKVRLPLEASYAPLEVLQHPIKSGLHGKALLLYADSHFGSGGREGIAGAFGELTGREVRVIDAETCDLRAADAAHADAILIYHTQKDASSMTRQTLSAWVEEGRPLFILHAGLGAWPGWEEYAAWCGNIWSWDASEHPHEAAVLRIAEGDPLNLGWSEAWLPKDEVFIKLSSVAEAVPGLTAEISSGSYPAAWRSKQHPHVGVWMPGHRRDSWTVPAMREGAARVLLNLMASSRAGRSGSQDARPREA